MPKEIDKKFLLQKVRLILIGKKDEELLLSLEYLGFKNILQIESGKEAIEHIRGNFYGFITCNMLMEDMNGLEFIRMMRNDSKSASRFSPLLFVVPASALTKQLVSDARDAGMTEILATPFNILPFKEKIMSIIENPRNFIISRNYTGPDRRRKKTEVTVERRKQKDLGNDKND